VPFGVVHYLASRWYWPAVTTKGTRMAPLAPHQEVGRTEAALIRPERVSIRPRAAAVERALKGAAAPSPEGMPLMTAAARRSPVQRAKEERV